MLSPGAGTGVVADNFGGVYVSGFSPLYLSSPMVNTDQATTNLGLPPGGAFLIKLNDQAAPIVLSTIQNPSSASQSLTLIARMSDARYTGNVEFKDGAQVLGTAAVANGVATLSTNLSAGIHRLRAIFHGTGPFDGSQSFEVIQVVNQ
jgi:hypothetical protein